MVCPVCTVAVAAGVGVLRGWGISDILTGIWFGALIVSSIMWFIDWMNRKNIHFLFRKIMVIASFYFIFIWPLYYWHFIGDIGNQIFGMDKLLFGVIIGTFVFIFGVLGDKYLRSINENKPLIKWQKVIVPVVFLIFSTIVAELLIRIFDI
jgi:ABC-type multidrug transport system permease subunit